mgnify:CR=1 FL=1
MGLVCIKMHLLFFACINIVLRAQNLNFDWFSFYFPRVAESELLVVLPYPIARVFHAFSRNYHLITRCKVQQIDRNQAVMLFLQNHQNIHYFQETERRISLPYQTHVFSIFPESYYYIFRIGFCFTSLIPHHAI